jgi:phosphate transport system substrate-binding protein
MKRAPALLLGLALSALPGCSLLQAPPEPSPRVNLRGAGASFPAPLYQRWFTHLRVRQGLNLDYRAVGSLEGEHQLAARLVDFAGSDRRPDQLPWLAIPMTAGAIAVAYNNPGCRLTLNREDLRGIFSGSITDYSQLGCRPLPIQVVVRSSGSGTTANLLRYLQVPQQGWHGASALLAGGNDAMATQLAQRQGAIGYLETVFLVGRHRLQAAAIENEVGVSVLPRPDQVKRALSQWPEPREGYPLVSPSWVLIPQTGLAQKAVVLQRALRYGLSPAGQKQVQTLGYAPLPRQLREQAKILIEEITP